MYIPRAWFKASAAAHDPGGRDIPVSAWGWGDDETDARRESTRRLQRMLERIGKGEPFPDPYGYGQRPPREEILQLIDDTGDAEAGAVLTRNGYGAQIMNTARILFLDVDLPPPGMLARLRRLVGLGGEAVDEAKLGQLRDTLRREGATFRIYRTASGFRVMCVDRDFDPCGSETHALMQATDTDPAFQRLCKVQKSFRARLTPKPWRCHSPLPPTAYPYPDAAARGRFASWLLDYEKSATAYATCRYLESVGSGTAGGLAAKVLHIHDDMTRCNQALPLA